MAPWHRWLESCATSKKGLEPVLTCLTWQMSLSLHSPKPASLLIKKSSPAWFDRAYILIKRHDGRWWLRGRSEDYAYHPPPDAALTMTRTPAPPSKSGNHVGNLSYWSMQSVSDIEPIDRTHFGCFFSCYSSFLFLLGAGGRRIGSQRGNLNGAVVRAESGWRTWALCLARHVPEWGRRGAEPRPFNLLGRVMF